MALKEKVGQIEDLALFEILKNPVLAIEFIHNLDREAHVEEFELTWYQKEMACDFAPYVSLCSARAIGKTLTISGMIVWTLVFNVYPTDYIVFTVPNKVHLDPVFTTLIRMFRSNSLLKHFIEPRGGINGADFTIKLLNQATLICRIAGQSGTGANVIGLHTPCVYLDEAAYYSQGTWIELQPIVNTWTPGAKVMVSGVPTGVRENNVLYHVDMENSSYTKHRITAHQNPRFSEEDEQRAIEQYGGVESEDYLHAILGQHGRPVFSIFDRGMMLIEKTPVYKLVINGLEMRDSLIDYKTKLAMIPGVPNTEDQVILGIDLGYCYSADTEVLTDSGWKLHKDVESGSKIANYNTVTNKLEWHVPEFLWQQDYKGKMISVTGKSTDFLVSPEHTVFIDNKTKEGYQVKKAKDLLTLTGKQFKVKLSIDKENIEGSKTFEVPYYYCSRKDRTDVNTEIDMDLWVRFLGWFTAEGSASANKNWEVNITQEVGEFADEIESLLNKLPYTISKKIFTTKWGKQQVNWRITCKELSLWLRENCGVHAQNKKIPNFIFDLPTKYKESFIDALFKGDGTRLASNRCPIYASSSKELLDDVQRLLVVLGYATTYNFAENYGMGNVTKGTRTDAHLDSTKNVKEVDYEGKIYCFKTTTGFYVTRRNGKISFQGNTEPTLVVVLTLDKYNRLRFHSKIQLNKVAYHIQELIIDMIDTKFRPLLIGVDKGNIGMSLTQSMMESSTWAHKGYDKRMVPIDFSGSIILGIDADGKEIKTKTKPMAVSILQDYTNNHRMIYSTTDPEMISELERMTYTKNPNGEIAYKTLTMKGGKKGEDHATSALLCGVMAYYLNTEFLVTQPKRKKLAGAMWNY